MRGIVTVCNILDAIALAVVPILPPRLLVDKAAVVVLPPAATPLPPWVTDKTVSVQPAAAVVPPRVTPNKVVWPFVLLREDAAVWKACVELLIGCFVPNS